MKTLWALVGLSILLGQASVSGQQTDIDLFCADYPLNSRCSGISTPPPNPQGTDFPVLSRDIDWRTDQQIPWSVPVYVRDSFDGDYLAVFDHNFQGSLEWTGKKQGVVSNWSSKYIRIYCYIQKYNTGFFSSSIDTTAYEARTLEIKIGDQIFKIDGDNGNFKVDDQLALALANAPIEITKIRLQVEGLGATITNDIGIDTVRSWHIIYGDSKVTNL